MPQQHSVAQAIAKSCARRGVRRVFGVPGGGSSLDLIRAFAEQSIDFVLARTETAAVIMAAATAEATGTIGVAIATQGPGAASAANGMAHASLDRAPVLLITDGWTPKQAGFDTHQVFDQRALMTPVTKARTRLDGDDVADELERVIQVMTTEPWGPAYVELTGENARRQVPDRPAVAAKPVAASAPGNAIAAARAMLAQARKPVILLGLEARAPGVGQEVRRLAERLGCPVLPTYKAKGILSDDLANVTGLFTGGAVEREAVGQADLIVLVGFDPVELIGRPWAYKAPVLDLAPVRHPVHYVEPALGVYRPLLPLVAALADAAAPTQWRAEELTALRRSVLARLAYKGEGGGLTPEEVVTVALEAAGSQDPRITVDAGAHMFSAMAFWRTRRQGDALISNGLATMAFALPAAIAMALHDPSRPTVAFTGDGGLMMCAGELATAAQHHARLTVVVFNDASLSLIAIKQRARQLPSEGVGWPSTDFAAVARGFGVEAFSADGVPAYRQALEKALAVEGPSLIDVRVDPSGYLAQSVALRG